MKQYDVHLIQLDPAVGHKIQKTRPCVIISPDEMNDNIGTLIIAPMTTKSHEYPSRVCLKFKGKTGWIVLDQIRTIDKTRVLKKVGKMGENDIQRIKRVIREMLVD